MLLRPLWPPAEPEGAEAGSGRSWQGHVVHHDHQVAGGSKPEERTERGQRGSAPVHAGLRLDQPDVGTFDAARGSRARRGPGGRQGGASASPTDRPKKPGVVPGILVLGARVLRPMMTRRAYSFFSAFPRPGLGFRISSGSAGASATTSGVATISARGATTGADRQVGQAQDVGLGDRGCPARRSSGRSPRWSHPPRRARECRPGRPGSRSCASPRSMTPPWFRGRHRRSWPGGSALRP